MHSTPKWILMVLQLNVYVSTRQILVIILRYSYITSSTSHFRRWHRKQNWFLHVLEPGWWLLSFKLKYWTFDVKWYAITSRCVLRIISFSAIFYRLYMRSLIYTDTDNILLDRNFSSKYLNLTFVFPFFITNIVGMVKHCIFDQYIYKSRNPFWFYIHVFIM